MAGAGTLGAMAAPSDRTAIGVIGSGGRGRFVTGVFQKDERVRVAGICDVYEPNLEKALSEAGKAGSHPQAFRDYRKLLESKEIDAVLIATPEHWHHRMVLDAIAAGKDIYVEKPLCQTPEQGVELLDAAKRSKSVIQVGMQRRSYDLYLEARKIVASGTLGNVRMVRSWWLNNSVGTPPATKLEGVLDWEQWQGPAPRRAFDPNRFNQWRLYSEYAGGILADQGAHVFDGIHLLMNAGYPTAATAEYPEDFIAVFSINYAAMRYKSRNDQLNQLDGDKARMDVGREECKVYLQGSEETAAISRVSQYGFGHATDLHVANFLECVRTRETPTAPVAVGFQAALVTQLANLSLEQGRRIRWNTELRKVEAA